MHARPRFVLALLTLVATLPWATSCSTAAAQPRRSGFETVDSLVTIEFARDSVAGMTVGVVSARGLVWTRSLGWADILTRRPADRRTVYRIGSVTKMSTGLMLQQLVAAGVVALEDPVERHYPEIRRLDGYAALATPVTFRELATMTSGLAREPRTAAHFSTGAVDAWEATLRSALPHTRIDAAQRGRFLYSNVGYAILGAALARAAGTPYVDWQRQRILAPLGMSHTMFEADDHVARELARGYEIQANGNVSDTTSDREARLGRGFRVPNGAMLATVDDLARFVQLWMGAGPSSVLARARLDSTYATLLPVPFDSTGGYGTGFGAFRAAGRRVYGHNGSVAGYTAAVYFDRERQVGVIVLRNARGGRVRTDALAFEMLGRLLDAPGGVGEVTDGSR